ncbi:MAG: peptidylprolyl isomerase [Bacteroidales bacterium]|nr:peptidylprolyl isomerase [Bacteroidales bacterium]
MRRFSFLRLLVIAAVAFLGLQASAQSKLDKKVLMTIGDQDITVKEFTDVYNKNNLKDEVVEKKSIDEYLDLFINFRMKVMEAYEMQLDTNPKFKKELNGYRKQLAKPYFTNDEISEELVEEAYQRKLKDIRASHILITCDKHALPSDTLKAYNKALDIRKKAVKGNDFGQLAVTYSQDPSARDIKATETTPARKGNRGDLGYFTVFDMVYPFETGAYNTPEGEISMPVRSDFGYHIIKVTSVSDALGTINASHIFLQLSPDATEEETQAMKAKADNIYKEVMDSDGKNWNEAVMKYSDDRGNASRSGTLTPFTVSRIVPEFIEAIKQLQPGEISHPIRTSYGYHIIKLNSFTGVNTFEKERSAIAERVEKDMRSKKSEAVVLQQIKKDYKFKSNDKNLEEFMAGIDSSLLKGTYEPADNIDLSKTLFTIGKSSFTTGNFASYLKAHQTAQRYLSLQTYAYQLYEAFQNEKLLAYADEHLEEHYPEFKALVQEYNDGILLFDLMDQEVWSKAVSDTAGLRAFHERNAGKYMWKDRVKACVITVNRPESLPKVKDYLAQGVPYDSLRMVIIRDTVPGVNVRNNFYQHGDNQYVDQTEWRVGVRNEIPSTVDNTTVIVNILEIRKPEPKTLAEARGLVTSDYQTELEAKWMEKLHQKYPVKINEKVLDQVRALYQ